MSNNKKNSITITNKYNKCIFYYTISICVRESDWYTVQAALLNYLYINENKELVEVFDPKPATWYSFKQKQRYEYPNIKWCKRDWFRGVFKKAGREKKGHHPVIEFSKIY